MVAGQSMSVLAQQKSFQPSLKGSKRIILVSNGAWQRVPDGWSEAVEITLDKGCAGKLLNECSHWRRAKSPHILTNSDV